MEDIWIQLWDTLREQLAPVLGSLITIVFGLVYGWLKKLEKDLKSKIAPAVSTVNNLIAENKLGSEQSGLLQELVTMATQQPASITDEQVRRLGEYADRLLKKKQPG